MSQEEWEGGEGEGRGREGKEKKEEVEEKEEEEEVVEVQSECTQKEKNPYFNFFRKKIAGNARVPDSFICPPRWAASIL